MTKQHFNKWLALSLPFCFATFLGAQSPPSQNPALNNNIEVFRTPPDRDVNHEDLSRFDRFLDDHREIAEQLRKDPSLANNQQFLKNHPALQNFLRQNPGIRDALKKNPNAFMSAEGRFDRSETDHRDLAEFDRFLDSHREISSQLRKDPSLVDNQQYLKDHSELQAYLQDHPEVRRQIDRNPNAFMQQENGYDRSEDRRDRELASFNQFLDSHREIAEQLRKQPSLADNQQFLKEHPPLQSYLQQHPEVRDQLAQNPDAFMTQEARYERTVQDRDRDRYAYNNDPERDNRFAQNDRDHDRDMDQDRDARRRFGEFLGSRQDIAGQLSRNPFLAKDDDYLRDHPELCQYLTDHPEVRAPLTADPDNFVKSVQQFNVNQPGGQTGKGPSPTAMQPKPNQ